MKRIRFFLPALFICLLTFSSCKKDYTCECTYINVINEPGTYSFEIDDTKKQDAEDACESFTFAGWTDIQCKLK
jgi:hypothetical protein